MPETLLPAPMNSAAVGISAVTVKSRLRYGWTLAGPLRLLADQVRHVGAANQRETLSLRTSLSYREFDQPSLLTAAAICFLPGYLPQYPTERTRRVPSGLKTIVVADNHPASRELVCELLATDGYNVLEASNGYEALKSVCPICW